MSSPALSSPVRPSPALTAQAQALLAGPVPVSTPEARAALCATLRPLLDEGGVLDDQSGGVRLRLDAAWGALTLALRSGRPVEHHAETSSTNTRARALAAVLPAGAPLPLVVADHQTAGRGRLGRSWSAAPGAGLLFSLVLRPPVPPVEAPRCVLLWAAAMAEVLGLLLKWPNDLVDAEGRKVGGMLAELDGLGADRVPSVILGVGINIEPPTDPALTQAGSLRGLGRAPVDRAALLGALVRAVDRVDPLDPAGLDRWRARAHTLGRRVRVAGREGLATGLREDGALLVDGVPILAGDVELVAGEAGRGTE
jgi:BirA family biotin operon repressor/biotin-[acetyl-CoA-carboxylase] ligase